MAPGHKSSADEPSSLHSTRDPFHINLPCTPPHTKPTIPAPAPSATFLSQSCPCPPPLTVPQHGLPAPIHVKDRVSRVLVSTTARHSVATVVTVEPTPQIALSAAVAIELGFPLVIVMHATDATHIALPLPPCTTTSPSRLRRPYRSNVNANVQRVSSTRNKPRRRV